MKTNIFRAKGHMLFGPGGWYCPCCGPAPKNRKAFVRKHKKRINRLLAKLEKDSE